MPNALASRLVSDEHAESPPQWLLDINEDYKCHAIELSMNIWNTR